jgi:hypothetical protein
MTWVTFEGLDFASKRKRKCQKDFFIIDIGFIVQIFSILLVLSLLCLGEHSASNQCFKRVTNLFPSLLSTQVGDINVDYTIPYFLCIVSNLSAYSDAIDYDHSFWQSQGGCCLHSCSWKKLGKASCQRKRHYIPHYIPRLLTHVVSYHVPPTPW